MTFLQDPEGSKNPPNDGEEKKNMDEQNDVYADVDGEWQGYLENEEVLAVLKKDGPKEDF